MWQRGVAAALLAISFFLFAAPVASAETRTLKLYFVHTREKAEITYKRNGRYDQEGLKKINRLLRDWRRNEPTKMDPRLMDVIWEAYQQSGANDYIHVICGYRSPSTNSMLRSRSKGVAKKSQHMLGKAMDFYIPGVKLKTLRNIGLKMQAGGVGYYPSSGSPFVHMDVGNVRHWPKMSRSELVAVFPSGKTLHVPSDGKPLPGYDQAVASYKSRKSGGGLAIASARNNNDDEGSSGSSGKRGGLLAFFGGGADEEEDNSAGAVEVAAAAPEPAPKKADAKAASKIRVMAPQDVARVDVPFKEAEQEPESLFAALPQRDAPLPGVAPRPLIDLGNSEAAETALPAATEAEAEVALNVPVPTWRPATASDEVSTLVALAESDVTDAGVPLPAGRPSMDSAEAALRAIAEAPLTDNGSDEFVVASLPEPAERPDAGAFAESPEEIIPATSLSKVAALGYAASPRKAIVTSGGADPIAAIGSGVKTTKKAARAKANDTKPSPRAIVVAAAPDEARWALNADPVSTTRRSTKAPSFAYRAVTSAPSEVLMAGFQRQASATATDRFSGKAVTFLPVARFQTN